MDDREQARKQVFDLMTVARGSQWLAIALFSGAGLVVAIVIAVGLVQNPDGTLSGEKLLLPLVLFAGAVISQIVSSVSNSRAGQIEVKFKLR